MKAADSFVSLFLSFFSYFRAKKCQKICLEFEFFLTLHRKIQRKYRVHPNKDIFLICFSRLVFK